MSKTAHIALLARYNAWMNNKLYEAAAALPPQELVADRKAFFGSLLATMNHLVVADTVWLQRFAGHPRFAAALAPVAALPAPASLEQPQADGLAALRARRDLLDQHILDWCASLQEDDFDTPIDYRSLKGVPARRALYPLLAHFFNHQTHHRGQASTLLSQAGIDIGVTDLVVLVPELDP